MKCLNIPQNFPMVASVTFDRNVFEGVLNPDKKSIPEDQKEVFRQIAVLIRQGEIIPYISETTFTLETLRKGIGERLEVLISRLNVLGDNVHPGSSDFDKFYLSKAMESGFKLLPNYRLGRVLNPEIQSSWRKLDVDVDIWQLTEKFGKVLYLIESNGGGFAFLKNLLGISPKDIGPWIKYAETYQGSMKKFDKAVAEWCDGDSVAIHIASGLDYFCTNDIGTNAGRNSVFSSHIRGLLEQQFALKIVKPEDLLWIWENR